jgi:hypothetical protein
MISLECIYTFEVTAKGLLVSVKYKGTKDNVAKDGTEMDSLPHDLSPMSISLGKVHFSQDMICIPLPGGGIRCW